MKRISAQSSRCFRTIVTFMLAFAMIFTSLALPSTTSKAAAKVKKVSIGVKVGSSGILVLKKGQKKKLKASVSPKKASKKLTYKSSKKSVVSVSSKGVVKARKKKGSAKITVTSAQNKKKKATITVKIGTPVKKVTIQKTAKCTWESPNKWTLKEVKGQMQKVYEKYTETLKVSKNTFTVVKGRMVTLKLTTSPKKPTMGKCQWTSSKKGILTMPTQVGKSCKLSGRKVGTTTVTAKALDGSGKSAKVKIKVVEYQKEATPTPVIEKDTRVATTVEDFEKYPVGTKWDRFTAGGYANSGSMTVVADPENPSNKVLKIEYNGAEQAYDFAPIFNLVLPEGKKLNEFSAIRLKSRMIANTAECNYKQVYCYFDAPGTMASTDYFATSNFDGSDPKEVPDRKNRFGVNVSMATGVDKPYNVPEVATVGNAVQDKDIISLSKGKKYNNKNLPSYYDDYSKGDKDAVSPGYSENETTAANKVGFQQNTIELNVTRIEAANISGTDNTPLLERNQLDMVLGSTYSGSMGKTYDQAHMTLYLDDIQVMSGEIPCTSMSFIDPAKSVACGNPAKNVTPGTAQLKIRYEPLNTTQRDVAYTSSDPSLASVDESGLITANNEGKTGNVTITATNKLNPAISTSTVMAVEWVEPASGDYNILTAPDTKILPKSDISESVKVASNVDTFKIANGELIGTFNAANVSVVLDLGKEMNLNSYKGLEIQGVIPGQIAVELYGSNLDMNKTKDNGSTEDWWETMSGKTFPFFVGSCAWRYEKGGMNYLKSIANGMTKWSDTKVAPSEETQRFSLNNLAKNCTGDWGAVRYVIIKSNKDPKLSERGVFDRKNVEENRTEFEYKITGLKFAADGIIDASDEGHYLMDPEKNVAEKDGNITSYYVDEITAEKPANKRSTAMNLSDFKYIRVKVKDTKNVKVGLVAEGKKLSDAEVIGEETGDGERFVYFSLAHVDKEARKAIDAISVEVDNGGSVTGLSATKGEIGFIEGETKVEVTKGEGDAYKCTPVTLDAYGTESTAS